MHLENMLHIQLVKTTLLTLIYLTSILSQSLYDKNFQQCHTFNRESSESSVEDLINVTETILKERTFKLEECNGRHKSIVDAYSELLRMNNKGIIPNDKTIDEICSKQPYLIIRSPEDCHRYYNCSGEDIQLSVWVEPYKFWPTKYKHECHYPFLYSEETMQCENYNKVNCGSRYNPTWECRYFRLTCKLSCKPCELDYPSCEHKANGLWPWPQYPHDPDYMQCKNGRRIKRGKCPTDPVWGVASFPYKGQCVHLFAVPKDYNPHGELPSCLGKVDGNYQYLVGYCAGYYKCESGVATAVKCPYNTLFDTASRTCKIGGKCIY
nr:uncharacterized protein LOC117682794 [Crassostrea gigas]